MIASAIFVGLLLLLLSMLRRKVKTSIVIFFLVFAAMIFLYKTPCHRTIGPEFLITSEQNGLSIYNAIS